MAEPLSSWVTLAHILHPQGRKGEVLADLLTDFPDTLTSSRALFLTSSTHPSRPPQSVEVVRYWLPHGRNQGRIVLEIAGVTSIAEAERLTALEVVVAAAERVPLADNSVYISDLVGLRVVCRGDEIGTVTGVSFPLSPDGRRLTEAAPLLEVQSGTGNEILVPFVKEFLVRVNSAAGVIEMVLPEGLTDINTASPRD